MARLLQELASRGVAPDSARRLLSAFPSPAPRCPDSGSSGSPSVGVQLMSEREVEVLQYIAAGLTNREIASLLYLSVYTVKAHTRSIYRKLDAHSRTQSVARARELGVLPRA